MTLVSTPGNPIPDGAVTGTIRTPDGVELRFARWGSPADAKGTVCVFTGRGEFIEKYFETARDLQPARLCGRVDGLARAGPLVAAIARSAQGSCRKFCGVRDRRRDVHAACGAARLSAALFCAGALDGRRGPAARRAFRPALVRAHGSDRAVDRSAPRPLLAAVAPADADAAAGRLWRHAMFRAATSTGRGQRASPAIRSPPIPRAMRATPRYRAGSGARHWRADGGLVGCGV